MAFRIYAEGTITSVWPADQLTLKNGKHAERLAVAAACPLRRAQLPT